MSKEEAVLTLEAHVFTIDQSNASPTWKPVTANAVSIQIFYSPQSEQHRIVSLEGQKAIINHTISSGTLFNKTSQKFGQWTDKLTSSTFGLGFGSEPDCTAFAQKFELAASTEKHQAPASQARPAAPVSPRRASEQAGRPTVQPGYVDVGAARGSSSTDSNPQEGQVRLKHENEKLKIALATSGKNAKKWELDLKTLKNNNHRLKEALHSSAANVETWKKQLQAWKDESIRLKKKVGELEASQSTQQQNSGGLEQQVQDLARENDEMKDQMTRDRQAAYQIQETNEKLKAELANWKAGLARKIAEVSGMIDSMPH